MDNREQQNMQNEAETINKAASEGGSMPGQTGAAKDQPVNAESAPEKSATPQNMPELDDSDEDLVTVDLNRSDLPQNKPEQSNANAAKNTNGSRQHARTNTAGAEGRPVRVREKKPVDPYKQKRMKKRIIWLVVLAVLIAAGLLVYFKIIKPARSVAEAIMNQQNETTDTIEERDIVHAISTTGLFEAGEVRTISRIAQDSMVDSVLVDVGDHVDKGDTLVLFSTDSINRSIEQLQEDLGRQKKKDAIDAKAEERSYLYTYTSEANDLYGLSEDVENALKALYEACDGYGDAKRALQAAKDEGKDEATIAALESAVNSAYQTEQSAQASYDSAVRRQANTIASVGNTLTSADESHQKSALNSGDTARDYARRIEDYQEKLENCVISAPISGTVTAVYLEEGNDFGTGGKMIVIQNTDTMKIVGRVDEYDVPDIKLGQRVVIRSDATKEEEMYGYVSFIEPTSTTTTSGELRPGDDPLLTKATDAVYNVTVTVQDVDPRIKIGMFAKLNIIVDQVAHVLTVPYDAIQTNAQGQYYVTVLDEDASAGGNAAGNPTDKSMPVLQINGENAGSGKAPGGKGGKMPLGKGGEEISQNRRDIIVEIGMEGDYYTQVISNELKPGMTVVVPDDGKFDMSDMSMMFGF
ncbi:MAG: efflux RND transporter periplasmic adaptor subunit [Lachnospiraceae bacterium]|nr:efflux RND transporter periplasmic adaptor subunit [Lachnospiraceae bacterium]